jgi:hypothetical protein
MDHIDEAPPPGPGARRRAAEAWWRRARGRKPRPPPHAEPRVVHVPMTDTLRERVRERHNYRGNRTTTTKYNALTFLPKALFEQYR